LSERDPLALAFFVGTKGRGSNLFAVHEAIQTGRLAARVAAVIGTRTDAPAIQRAEEAGLPVRIVDPKRLEGGEGAYEATLLATLRETGAATIVLAGFLRRLPSGVVRAFRHRILNIHPALLPAFGGKGMYGIYVHQAVLEHGCKVSGCTVHFADETYDTGPIIAQRAVPVEEGDTPEDLAARILPCEHTLLVEALQLIAADRITVEGRVVHIAPEVR